MKNSPPDRCDLLLIPDRQNSRDRVLLVISPRTYNEKTGRFLCCPVTTRVKGYPFEVLLRGSSDMKGVVLADRLFGIDWRETSFRKKGATHRTVLDEVIKKLKTVLEG